MKSSIIGLFCFALTVLVATHASAQMNNRPFSFGGGGSGLGMSKAGQQAILLQKLEGRTPDNIIRGADGLITIERRRGNNAIAFGPDGATIPRFRGRNTATVGGVGIFNPFFLGGSRRNYGSIGLASRHTSNQISGWTNMVNGGGYRGGGSIDAWTSMVGG